MGDLELQAYVAGFKEGVRHYAWWVDQPHKPRLVVGEFKEPIEAAMKQSDDDAVHYYKRYRQLRDAEKKGGGW